MSLILYDAAETVFENNGIGVLPDAVSARVYREINGAYELTLKYPTTGLHAEHIRDRSIILTKPDPETQQQPFRVYRIVPVSKGTVTVYARHLAYDMAGIPVAPFTAESLDRALVAIKDNAVVECPFTFSTDKIVGSPLTVQTPKSIWNLLGGSTGSLLDAYGGEYEFDRYNITLRNRLGMDRGVSIRYGKNLTSLEQDRNCANCYTGVYPYWESLEGDVVQLPEKILSADGNYGYTKIITLDLSDAFETAPSEDQLRSRAQKYMQDNQIGIPDVSWKIEFIPLEQTQEYKDIAILERVGLGDTVSVDFPWMGISTESRVVATDYDVLRDRYNDVTIGSVKNSFAQTIVHQQQQINQKPSSDFLQKVVMAEKTAREEAVNRLASALAESAGFFQTDVQQSDGSTVRYLHDKHMLAESTNVVKITAEAWGFSTDGGNTYPFGWQVTGDMVIKLLAAEGIDAEQIRVRNLIAEKLNSVLDRSRVAVDGAKIIFLTDEIATMEIFQAEGAPILYMYDIENGVQKNNTELSSHHLKIGGTSVSPAFEVSVANEKTRMNIGDGTGVLIVRWKNNGDGTFTLIGEYT